jgi:hypothetical protein
VEKARKEVADLIGADPKEIIFTSVGGPVVSWHGQLRWWPDGGPCVGTASRDHYGHAAVPSLALVRRLTPCYRVIVVTCRVPRSRTTSPSRVLGDSTAKRRTTSSLRRRCGSFPPCALDACASVLDAAVVVVDAQEHKCVLDSCRWLELNGFEVTYLPVQQNGLLNLADLEAAIRCVATSRCRRTNASSVCACVSVVFLCVHERERVRACQAHHVARVSYGRQQRDRRCSGAEYSRVLRIGRVL